MDNNSLSYKTLKNISYSFVGYAWPIIFSVFITPIVVRKLGIVDYGVYVLVNTITAFLTLIDFGLGSALIKYISEYYASGQTENLRALLKSANSLLLITGVAGFLLFAVIGQSFLWVFKISPSSQIHISEVFILAGLVFLVNTAANAYNVIPIALQRYDVYTKLNLIQLTVYNLGLLVVVLLGFKLKVIFAWNLVTIVPLAAAFIYYSKKLLPQNQLTLGWDGGEVRKAYKFGLFAALANLSYSALMQLDRLIIPIFLGPAQLTYYSLPGNVAQKSAGISGSLGSIFFPLASALQGGGETAKIEAVYKKGFRNITIISAALSLAIAVFGYKILFFWLGQSFADKGYHILIILSATFFVLSVYAPLTNFLMGLGKVRFLTSISASLALLNLLLLFLLVPRYGITGAAWAFLGGVAPVPLFFYWTEKKILGLSGMGIFYLKLYSKLLATAALFYIICKIFLLSLVYNFLTLVIIGPAAVIVYLALYKLLGFYEREDWETVKGYTLKFF